MTPQAAVTELLERLGAARKGKVYVDEAELKKWPPVAVAAMKQQKLLARARPAKSVVCPGCERACAMPVQTQSRADGNAASFVVCDKRDDINRVPILAELLRQWHCDAEAVCDFIAASLGIRRSEQTPASDSLLPIGVVRGDEQRQMLCLRVNGQLDVVAGNRSQPLAEVIEFDRDRLVIDANAIRQLVDSATTTAPAYTPSIDRREERKAETLAMYQEWRRAYRDLKKKRPDMSAVWYAKQIAKTQVSRGKSYDTIRKHM